MWQRCYGVSVNSQSLNSNIKVLKKVIYYILYHTLYQSFRTLGVYIFVSTTLVCFIIPQCFWIFSSDCSECVDWFSITAARTVILAERFLLLCLNKYIIIWIVAYTVTCVVEAPHHKQIKNVGKHWYGEVFYNIHILNIIHMNYITFT